MKKMFVFALMLAMFIALTGGYGQVINSDWVTRSFTSAAEETSSYPTLVVGQKYRFFANASDQSSLQCRVGTVIEQDGRWVKFNANGVTDNPYWANLDNLVFLEEYKY